jgi:NAD(P)-dependent dehydrogenase (short-subunit alcohol dehydrogenase family)
MQNSYPSLKGKAGILTGGTSGFGLALVRALVAQGANVSVFSVDQLTAENEKLVRESGDGEAHYTVQDITADGAAEAMVAKAKEQFGKIDFVIANAGVANRFQEPFLGYDSGTIAEKMRHQFNLFPIAFATLATAAAKEMAPRYKDIKPDETGHRPDSGAIVVTLSESVFCPLRDDLVAYAAAKTAARSVMESLTAILGPYNIRVNGIAPGFANTEAPRRFYSQYPQIRDDIDRKIHLKPSFMDPTAVVAAVLYLLTDNYVTGDVVALDGGFKIEQKNYFQDYS